jgi:hypothetical protein
MSTRIIRRWRPSWRAALCCWPGAPQPRRRPLRRLGGRQSVEDLHAPSPYAGRIQPFPGAHAHRPAGGPPHGQPGRIRQHTVERDLATGSGAARHVSFPRADSDQYYTPPGGEADLWAAQLALVDAWMDGAWVTACRRDWLVERRPLSVLHPNARSGWLRPVCQRIFPGQVDLRTGRQRTGAGRDQTLWLAISPDDGTWPIPTGRIRCSWSCWTSRRGGPGGAPGRGREQCGRGLAWAPGGQPLA